MPLKTKITKKQANTLFVIQCLEDVTAIGPTTDDFNNIIYPMPAKLVKGNPIIFGKDNQYKIEQGDSFDWQISKALYNTIIDMGFSGKAKLGVKMVVTADSTSWMVADPDDMVFEDDMNKLPDETSQIMTEQPDKKINYGYKDVRDRDDSRALDIKWGMSFNKACDIVIARKSGDSKFFEDAEEVQVAVRNMTHRLMNVATGLDIWIKENNDKSFEQSKIDEMF